MSGELKTLTDLLRVPGRVGEYPVIEADKLRSEAVKWVKELEKRGESDVDWLDKPFRNFVDSGYDEYASHPFNNVINWIIHFFNLSEGDLK